MNRRFLAQHFTVNIRKLQLPKKGVKSQLPRSSYMYMCAAGKKGSFTQYPVSSVHVRKRQRNMFFKGALMVSLMAMIQLFLVSGLPSKPKVSRSGSLEAVQCTKMRCGDKDPCCNGQYCCDKKFWPKSQKDCGDDKYVCKPKGCGCKKFEKVWGG